MERAIISSILFDGDSFADIESDLETSDFVYQPHQIIFETFKKLHSLELPIDEPFLKKYMPDNKKVDDEELLHIISTNPIANIEAYVTEIRDNSLKRKLHSLANVLREKSQKDNERSDSILEAVEQEIYKISTNNNIRDFRDSPEISDSTLKLIEELKKKGTKHLIGLDTGFVQLNKMTTGFNKGELIILAARPSMGKTALALNFVLNTLNRGKGVAMFSLEMPAEHLMMRMLSSKCKIHLQNLRTGNMNDEEWGKLTIALEDMSKKRLYVDDGGVLSIRQISSKMRKLKSKYPEIELLVVDYLQIMIGSSNKERHLEVGEIRRGLKMLARELEIPIIALSQLSRALESRNDKKPMLSDIRESGAIEQDADVIMFIYREDVYKKKDDDEARARLKKEGKDDKGFKPTYEKREIEDAIIIIGKNRNGEVGDVHVKYQGSYTMFYDSDIKRGMEGESGFRDTRIESSGDRGFDIEDMRIPKI